LHRSVGYFSELVFSSSIPSDRHIRKRSDSLYFFAEKAGKENSHFAPFRRLLFGVRFLEYILFFRRESGQRELAFCTFPSASFRSSFSRVLFRLTAIYASGQTHYIFSQRKQAKRTRILHRLGTSVTRCFSMR